MTLQYSPKKNPRVIIIQKLYGKYFNNEKVLIFPKHKKYDSVDSPFKKITSINLNLKSTNE